MPNSPGLSPGPAPLRLTAKLDDTTTTTGPQGITMDAHTRPELGRRGQRPSAEQLTSPRVEVPNGVGGDL
jgi:hypothetical protein